MPSQSITYSKDSSSEFDRLLHSDEAEKSRQKTLATYQLQLQTKNNIAIIDALDELQGLFCRLDVTDDAMGEFILSDKEGARHAIEMLGIDYVNPIVQGEESLPSSVAAASPTLLKDIQRAIAHLNAYLEIRITQQ